MFSRLSVRAKIVLVVSITIASSILFVAGTSVWREASRYAETRTQEVLAIARVLASETAEALAAGERVAALRLLRSIRDFEGVTYARVEYANGQPLAEIGTGVVLETDIEASNARDPFAVLAGRPLIVAVPVRHAGEEIGALVLFAETSGVWARITSALVDLLFATIFASVLGIAAANIITRRITAPIKDLSEAMTAVREQQDFKHVVPRVSDDETGLLTDAFNDLLAHIRTRDDRLSRHREHLEKTVERRTAELRVAKDEAEIANAAKSDFLATMSHEIRTPMNGMLVSAELLASSGLPDRLQRYAEVISKSGQSLLAIINDILDFSKIESGRMELEDATIDVRAIVFDVLDVFFDRAHAQSLDLVATIDSVVPETITGDPVRVRQVLSNLVSNAIKFTEAGFVSVAVELGQAPDTLRFSVSDTGVGVPPEKRETIFDSFAQADQTTTRKYGGTGLGLAICRRLIEAMGGAIWVDGRSGGGSVFVFEIALMDPSAAPVWGSLSVAQPVLADVALSSTATAAALRAQLKDVLPNCQHVTGKSEGTGRGVTLRFRSPETLNAPTDQQPGKTILVAAAGDERADAALLNGQCDAVVMLPVSHTRLMAAIEDAFDPQAAERRATARERADVLPQWSAVGVLVADDSPVNLEVAKDALERFGITPQCVADGQAAIEAASANRFDLILMDCSMPVVDGYAATRAIRDGSIKTPLGEPVPIVALTANVAADADDQWRAAGMSDYLAKPFTLSQLRQCLEAWLPAPDSATTRDEPVAREGAVETAAPALVDIAALEAIGELTGGSSADLLKRLLKLFTDNAPNAVEQIAEAAAAKDLNALGSAAHALKSMSHNVGAVRLAAHCANLESSARAGRMEIVGEAGKTRALFKETIAQLSVIIENGDGQPLKPSERQRTA